MEQEEGLQELKTAVESEGEDSSPRSLYTHSTQSFSSLYSSGSE